MIFEDYFYRKLGTSQFVHDNSALNRKIVPVRLKNEFCDKDWRFDLEKKVWSEARFSDSALDGENNDEVFFEYPESAIYPKIFIKKSRDIEDNPYSDKVVFAIEGLYPDELEKYLKYREELRRYQKNYRNQRDDNGFEKTRFAFTVITDDENLTLKLKIHDFKENGKGEENLLENLPSVAVDTFIFDMKNGVVKVEGSFLEDPIGEINSIQKLSFDKERKAFLKYYDLMEPIKRTLEEYKIPENVLSFAFSKLLFLASRYTGIPLENYENREKPENYRLSLSKFYSLVKIPSEPDLFEVLCEGYFVDKKIKINREDTEVLKKLLRKFRVKDCKILRRAYAKNPQNLNTFIHIREAGFKDLNLYQRVFDTPYATGLFDGAVSLRFFVKYSKIRRGEVCTMNTLLKNYTKDSAWIVSDGIHMFREYFSQIPEELKKDILKNGFSEFNHDALENLEFKKEHKNYSFKYSDAQRRLEGVIDGYQFLLPKDAYELCDLGTVMHNCVATYAPKVKKKECTIIYAKRDDNPVLCIEVRKNEIWQERADHNLKPNREEADVLSKWHERHGLEVL